MLTSLFVMNVFAEKTYVSDNKIEIDTLIIKLNVSNLEITIDSLELKSIQSNRPEEKFVSHKVNNLDSVNIVSLKVQYLLKSKNNHLKDNSIELKPIRLNSPEETLMLQDVNILDSINVERSEIPNSLKTEKKYLTIDPLDLNSFQFNLTEDRFISQEVNNSDSINIARSEIPNLLRIENNQFYNIMPLSSYDSQPLLNLSLQYEENYEYNAYKGILRLDKKRKLEKLKVIGLYSTAVILNAIGDGLNNSNSKTMGHFFNAASIGVLLYSPFFINYDKSKWYWYLLSYTALRVTLFDVTYNITTKRPVNFIGSTAITDKIHKIVDLYSASKAVGLVIGLTIPFNLL